MAYLTGRVVACVDRAAARPVPVLRHVRPHLHVPQQPHKFADVVGLVRRHGANRLALSSAFMHHQQRRLTLGPAVGFGHHGIGDQTIAILQEHVAEITQPGFLSVTLAI